MKMQHLFYKKDSKHPNEIPAPQAAWFSSAYAPENFDCTLLRSVALRMTYSGACGANIV